MKFIHSADFHFYLEAAKFCGASLEALIAAGEQYQPDFWAFPGDLFELGIQNSEAGGLPIFLAYIKRMLDIAPILAASGTITHDVLGCYAPLVGLSAKHPFRLLQAGDHFITDKYLVLGCPEPSKEWFLASASGLSLEAANQRVADGMKNIFLGLGVIRKQNPNLPAVMLYHGPVVGSKMANGQTVRPGIKIGRDDLALVGADYYALGDIHEAQQIPGIPAYYSGDIYPKNWGELTRKTFNLVTIEPAMNSGSVKFSAKVELLPFPHPPRKKIVVDFTDPRQLSGTEGVAVGYQVWVVVKGTKEQLQEFDTAAALERLMGLGALRGSRVTTSEIHEETVRSKEITKAKRLRDKVVVWARDTGLLPPSESVLLKADKLETDFLQKTQGVDFYYQAEKIRIRGAKGIWKGLRKDEITVDLSSMDPGILALLGDNGKGKTTVFSLFHPFSVDLRYPTRPIHKQFRLKDSAVELWFTDKLTGDKYRKLFLINGPDSKAEYFLFREGNTKSLTNGRIEDYDKKIEKLMGPLELYMRSAYTSQKPTKDNPDLAAATEGEKKTLFRSLAGLDGLQEASQGAKAEGDNKNVTLGFLQRDIDNGEAAIKELPSEQIAHRKIQVDLESANAVSNSMIGIVKDAKALVETLTVEAEAHKLNRVRAKALLENIANGRKIINECDAQMLAISGAIKGKAEVEAQLKEIEGLAGKEREEVERLQGVNKERDRIRTAHADELASFLASEKKLSSALQAAKDQAGEILGQISVLTEKIAAKEAILKTPATVKCQKCSADVPVMGQEKLDEEKAALVKLVSEKGILLHARDIAAEAQVKAEEALAAIGTAPKLPQLPDDSTAALQEIRATMRTLDPETLKRKLEIASNAQAKSTELERQRSGASFQLMKDQAEVEELDQAQDTTAQGKLIVATTEYEKRRQEISSKLADIAALQASMKAQEKVIAGLKQTADALDANRRKLAEEKALIEEWRFLERACGPDGIQALELDNMGPGIDAAANAILHSTYGPRFSIEIRTQRTAGAGSNRRKVEDFSIWILDSECPEIPEQELSSLSGGEAVWIYQAIYAAFAIIRDENTGKRFLTVFADEADGALSAKKKKLYYDMLHEIHVEAKRDKTIVITQDPVAAGMIEQKIVMDELGAA